MHQSDEGLETEVCPVKLHESLASYQLSSISGQLMCPVLSASDFKH